MDDRHLFPGKGSVNRPLASQTDQGCKFDDVDGILYDSVFGILKSAIKKWDSHAHWGQSDEPKHDYQQESELQDRKSISLPRNRNKLDNILPQRKDLKPKQSQNKDNDKKWDRYANWDQCDKSKEHDYQQKNELQDRKLITLPRNRNKVDNMIQQKKGRKSKQARNRELDRTRANGDVSPEMVNTVKNITNMENGKASQKTDIAPENTYLGSEGGVRDSPTTPNGTKVCLKEGEECPENVRELRLSIFLNKSNLNTPIILHINDKNSLSSKLMSEGDTKSWPPHSITTDAKLEDRRPVYLNEKKVKSQPPHLHTTDAKSKYRKTNFSEGEFKSRPPHSHTTNAQFEDRKTDVKTKVSGPKMAICDEKIPPLVPPRNVPGEGNNQHIMPTSKSDFDRKDISCDGIPSKKGDDADFKESIREESLSILEPVGSISPHNASFPDKPSKDLSESIIPLEMFTDKNQIRYDAIKVLAEIQMDNLKKSYLDWQNKFLMEPGPSEKNRKKLGGNVKGR